MARNNLDKLHIELYANGVFQGYAKHVSVVNRKVQSTQHKVEALSFSTQGAANKICEKIDNITQGYLTCLVN